MTKAQILTVLEANSSRCMDSQADREALADVLVKHVKDHVDGVVEQVATWLEGRAMDNTADLLRRGEWS